MQSSEGWIGRQWRAALSGKRAAAVPDGGERTGRLEGSGPLLTPTTGDGGQGPHHRTSWRYRTFISTPKTCWPEGLPAWSFVVAREAVPRKQRLIVVSSLACKCSLYEQARAGGWMRPDGSRLREAACCGARRRATEGTCDLAGTRTKSLKHKQETSDMNSSSIIDGSKSLSITNIRRHVGPGGGPDNSERRWVSSQPYLRVEGTQAGR